MINNVGSYSMQNQNYNQLLIKNQQPESEPKTQPVVQPQPVPTEVLTTPAKQSSVLPLHKYIEANQKINLIASTLGGIFWGLGNAKEDLQKTIVRAKSMDEQKLARYVQETDNFIQKSRLKPLAQEVLEDPTRLKYKDLFTTTELSRTIQKVGGKALMIAGALYALDYACQKFFKNNKEYEEYYQDSLKNQ